MNEKVDGTLCDIILPTKETFSHNIENNEGDSEMSIVNLNNVPPVSSFNNLNIGDKVYSNIYGVGKISRFYDNDVIVNFEGINKRFSVDDQALKLVPKELSEKRKPVATGMIDGKKVGFRTLKKQMKSDLNENFITIAQAAGILGMSVNKFEKLASQYSEEIRILNNKKMIAKNSLYTIQKIIFKHE